jgi:spore germination protein GerM
MMKRHVMIWSLFALMVSIVVVVSAGCGGNKSSNTGSSQPTGKSQANSTQGTQPAEITVSMFFLKGEVFTKVTRPSTKPGPEAGLIELLKGPSASEKQQGLLTAIPSGVTLLRYSSQNGQAKVDLSKELENYGGGSAKVQAIVNQINNTVMSNDSTVKSVSITVAGVPAEEVLQP